MGLRSWWRERRAASKRLAANLALNTDQEIIASQVPELVGMSDVEGMAYVMRQIDEWNTYATPEQAAVFAGRLMASNQAWQDGGAIMPYWGNLWVLRTYQRELGIDVPEVTAQGG